MSDSSRLDNPQDGKPAGPEAALKFTCGAHGEFTVDGWEARPSAEQRTE